jgi:23S rRNA pseudouridine1911/1915/1917 synthase
MARKRFVVGRGDAGRRVADWLADQLSLTVSAIRRLVSQQRVRIAGAVCRDPARHLEAQEQVEVELPELETQHTGSQPHRGQRHPQPIIRHADDEIVVVDKPAGLTTMRHPEEAAEFGRRAQRYLPPTLADLLPDLLAGRPGGGRPVIAVHRLDRDTSGLVVFARTPEAARHLGRQLRAHTVERVYQAIVRGKARDGRIESWLIADRGDGRRGSAPESGKGQHVVTHVRVVEPLGDYTLVECRLETGRTHQLRIHLGEAGTPLCGERVYDRPQHGKPAPDGSGMKRVALHAAVLGFEHPAPGQHMRWTAPLPADMRELLGRLRRTASHR